MTPKTIAEATAKCTDCQGRGYHTEMFEPHDRHPCEACNGTGYACGVAPTELERLAIIAYEAIELMMMTGPGELLADQLLGRLRQAASTKPGPPRASFMAEAAALALSTRKEQ